MKIVLTVYNQSEVGQVLDLYPGDSIALNYKFNDLLSLTGSAPFSREFRVPATANNCSVFGYQYDFSHISTNGGATNIRRKFRAYLTVEGIPLVSGYVQFKQATITNGTAADFSLVFFGDVADILADIKDKKLSDIIIDENEDTRTNSQGIDEANAGGIDPNFGSDFSDGRLKYALIDKGLKIETDGGVNDNPQQSIDSNTLTPCFNLKFLVNCINNQFLTNGKRILFSDEIDEHLSRIYIPYANEKTKHGFISYATPSPIFSARFSPGVDATTAITTWTPLTINGQSKYVATLPAYTIVEDFSAGLSGNNLVYTFLNNVTCRIQCNISLQATAAVNSGLRIYFKITSGASVLYLGASTLEATFMDYTSAGINIYNPLYNPATAGNIVDQSAAVCLPIYSNNGQWTFYQGDTVEVILAADYDIGATGNTVYVVEKINDSIGPSYFFMNSQYSVDPVSNVSYFEFHKMAPDYLLTDLINDILKAHNAVILPDIANPGRVRIYTMNEYLGAGDTDDWTDLLNIDSDIVLQPTTEYQTKRQYFSYSDANDYLNELYKNGAYRTFGRLDLFDSSSDFTTGETKIELKAKPTPNNTLINSPGVNNINIPKFVDATYNYKAPGPRWLYFQGLYDFEVIQNTGSTFFTVALMGNYSDNTPNIDTLDLNFGVEVPLHELDANPYKTLYYRYYNNYLAELYSPESKVIEASFMLGIKEIFNLQFNTSIFLFNTYWRVLEVNDYVLGANNLCRVKLIRKLSNIEVTPQCLLTPVTIDIYGEVRWMNSDGAQQPGTEACCNQIGYNWDRGKCLKPNKDPRPNSNPGNTGIKDPNSSPTKPNPTQVAISSGNVLIKDETGTTKNVIASGENIALIGDNKNTLAMGRDILVNEGVNNSAVIGTGLDVKNRGIWYGKGDGTLANATAHGTMVDKISGIYSAVNTLLYTPEFKVDSNSFYTVEIKVSFVEIDTGAIHNSLTHIGSGIIQVDDTGNIYSYSDPDEVIKEIATAGTWEVGLDATGSDTIRVYVKNTGGLTYPTLTWTGTVTTIITQVRI
jgi:hypothetical protein